MKRASILSVLMCMGATAGYCAGFLSAQKFPGVFSDLPFITRMQVLEQGYDGFESQFDANGRCISNCPYGVMNLDDMQRLTRENTDAGNAYIDGVQSGQITHIPPEPNDIPPTDVDTDADTDADADTDTETPPSTGGGLVLPPVFPPVEIEIPEIPEIEFPIEIPPVPDQPDVPTMPIPNPVRPPVSDPEPVKPPQIPTWSCRTHSSIVRPNNSLPTQAPIDINLVITSDFGPRKPPTQGASSVHGGLDFSAPIGTPVFSPANGVVSHIYSGGSCGNGLIVDHGGGFQTKYCHLRNVSVKKGERVQSGCLIGNTGNTGTSTGPHLHYAIIYRNAPFDPLYPTNHLGRSYTMHKMSPGRPAGITLPGRK